MTLLASGRFRWPRRLALVFGEYFFLVAFGASVYALRTVGRWYTADVIRVSLIAFAGIGAAFLALEILLSFSLERTLDRRLENVHLRLRALAREAALEGADGGAAGTEAEVGDADAFAEILDELGAYLEEVSEDLAAEPAVAEAETVAPELAEALESRHRARDRVEAQLLVEADWLTEGEARLQAYVQGPTMAAGALLALSGTLIPAADGFLLASYQVATAVLVGCAYAVPGVVAYLILSYMGLLRTLRGERETREEALDAEAGRIAP